MRKRQKIADGLQNFFADLTRGFRVIASDKLPNVENVLGGFGMKVEV
jgi:hypothetical protein